ncbi:MAG: hypothetical protein IT582_07875 [Opitutaceae bacterium]|nr:hypothetical protein [Opitutaceae bacterium]
MKKNPSNESSSPNLSAAGATVNLSGSGQAVHAVALDDRTWKKFQSAVAVNGEDLGAAFDMIEDSAIQLFNHQGPTLDYCDCVASWVKATQDDDDNDQQAEEFLSLGIDEIPEAVQGMRAIVIKHQDLKGIWTFQFDEFTPPATAKFSREYFPLDVCWGETALQEPIVSAIIVGERRATLREETNIDVKSEQIHVIELPQE